MAAPDQKRTSFPNYKDHTLYRLKREFFVEGFTNTCKYGRLLL